MEKVQPLRDLKVIAKFKNELAKNGSRDELLFVIGINTGLRISDILDLKVKHVRDTTHIIKRDIKTGKSNRFLINHQLRTYIDRYIESMDNEDWLFPSRKGDKAISRIQAYRILNSVADKLGIEEVGTHTLRKTFGYFHYKMYKDVALLQQIFNHSSPSITLAYIGINQDMRDNSIKDFFL